jgi:antitoxin VapB
MAINITSKEADRLTRRLAQIEGVSLTEAVVMAMHEALERRLARETPSQTAARLRAELGIELKPSAKRRLDRSVFDEYSGEPR